MGNRYPSTCYRCGGRIAPNEGVFERVGRAQKIKWSAELAGSIHKLPKWLGQHHDCAQTYRGTKVHYLLSPAKQETKDEVET